MLNNFVPNLVDPLLSRFHFKDHNIELEKKREEIKKTNKQQQQQENQETRGENR